MRCLAVQQPWAWTLISGAKDIENRTWSTDYRGPVVILASGTKARVNYLARLKGFPKAPVDFTYGALIGVVDVIDVVPLSEALEDNPWAWGPYCWRIGNARKFAEPISAKGKLNLFTLSPDLTVQAQMAMGASTCISWWRPKAASSATILATRKARRSNAARRIFKRSLCRSLRPDTRWQKASTIYLRSIRRYVDSS